MKKLIWPIFIHIKSDSRDFINIPPPMENQNGGGDNRIPFQPVEDNEVQSSVV
jgi:hypothetical protein